MPKPLLSLKLDPAREEAPGFDGVSIGADKFEGHGVVVDKAGVRMDADGGGSATGPAHHHSGEAAVSFDDVELVRKLGAGCSATVHLARDKRNGKLYAVKCINIYDKSVREMLMMELATLFKSDCEALVDFHGATYREGQVAVILEFMDLGGLDNVLKRAPGNAIPERALAAMAFQMLYGLGYLVYERRLHRDIKPQNILVNTNGQVKLTDFGISRELSTAVLAKTFIGSFKYMSPERIMHQPYDYASDVWSLGLVLLVCALGRYPYPEPRAQIAMVMILTEGDIPLPPREGGKFTPEFHDFLEKCIARDPKARATAAELLDSDWLAVHGIDSFAKAVAVVHEWLVSIGCAPPAAAATAAVAAAGGAGTTSATAAASGSGSN